MSKIDMDTQIFEECLVSLENGQPLEEILSRYPEQAAELGPLLETAIQTRQLLTSIRIPSAARSRSRARFLSAARDYKEEKTRSKAMLGLPTKPVIASPRSGRMPTRPAQMSLYLRAAFIMALIVVLAGGFGAVKASARTVPGDALYPLKRAAENTRLLLEPNPSHRLELEREFGEERVTELQILTSQSRSGVKIDFGGPVEAIGAEWRINGVRILVDEQTQIDAILQVGDYAYIHGDLAGDGSVFASRIESEKLTIQGSATPVAEGVWAVSQATIKVTQRTSIEGDFQAGSIVSVDAILLADNSWLALQIKVDGWAPNNNQAAATQVPPTNKPTVKPYVPPTEAVEPSRTPVPTEPPHVEPTEEKPTESGHEEPTEGPRPTRTPRPTDNDDDDHNEKATATPGVTLSPTRAPRETQTPTPTYRPRRTPTKTPTKTATKTPDDDD